MGGHVIAAVLRQLRDGLSRRAIARQRQYGEKISEQSVRRIDAGQFTPRGQVYSTYARCRCGGLVKTCRPCLKCQLENAN